jgi:hypothetical protein
MSPIRSISLWLLFACASYAPTPQGTERLGDAIHVFELGQHADAVIALEDEYLQLIESVAGEERFNLYRNYNRLMGTWLQVDFLQSLLDRAVEATSRLDEEEARSMLRDHAQYTLWELDSGIAGLEESSAEAQRWTDSRINERSRSLLSSVRMTVNRLLIDHCAAAPCVVGPQP